MTKRLFIYARLAIVFIMFMLPSVVDARDKGQKKRVYEYTQEYAFSGVRSIVVKSESSRFYRNRVTGHIEVQLIQSKDERVVVSIVRESDREVFKIEKIGNTLKLNAGDKDVEEAGHPDRPEAVVTVYTKDVNRLELGGANELVASGYFTGRSLNLKICGASQVFGLSGRWNDLNVNLSGAADLSLVKVDVSNVDLECQDAVDCCISGKGKMLKVNASGSSDVNAENFVVKDVDAKLSGAADITVNASGSIMYSLTGSADLDWIGAPEIIRK